MIVGIDVVRTRREVPQGMKGQYPAIQRSPVAVASAALLSVCLRSVRGGTMRKAARACNPPNWGEKEFADLCQFLPALRGVETSAGLLKDRDIFRNPTP
jgi:hypothetical protein